MKFGVFLELGLMSIGLLDLKRQWKAWIVVLKPYFVDHVVTAEMHVSFKRKGSEFCINPLIHALRLGRRTQSIRLVDCAKDNLVICKLQRGVT